jgi:peptidoglycan/xylan/chitin deacetylase (PgdA/CDA1 family)
VIFVAAEAIGRHDAFWQERLYAAWRSGDLTVGSLHGRAAGLCLIPAPAKPVANSEAALRDCIAALARVPPARRDDLVEQCAAPQGGPAEMASVEQTRLLAANGVAVGAHGYSHEALTEVDAQTELLRARERLRDCLSGTPSSIVSMSFPHGLYDGATVDVARNCGYRLLFTSDPALTPLARGCRLNCHLLGRIDIPARAIVGSDGEFSPERMATWLFTRPTRRLGLR